MKQTQENDYFNESYIPSLVRVGRIVLLAAIVYFFIPFLWTWLGKGVMPHWKEIAGASVIWLMMQLPWYISEPIAYFPVQGITGMLICSLAGNASNMRMPCALTAQKAAGVKPGTQQGTLVSTIAIAATCFVSIGILAVFVIAGQSVLNMLPDSVTNSLSLMLPALFGCVFAQFMGEDLPTAGFCMAIGLGIMIIGNTGVLNWIPFDGVYLLEMLLPIMGGIAFAYAMQKRRMAKKGSDAKGEEQT